MNLKDIRVGQTLRVTKDCAAGCHRAGETLTVTKYTSTSVTAHRCGETWTDIWWGALLDSLEIVHDVETPEAEASGATPALPDGNPKTRFGVAKPPISLIPGLALVLVADAFRDGAAKYGPANWRVDPVTTSTYMNAAGRHMLAWQDGEENASDSHVHHLAHAAACLMILLDAQGCNTLQDDRPPPAPTGETIRKNTRPLPETTDAAS